MNSRITIEFDFDNQEPFIQVYLDHGSSDLRDRMMCHFFENSMGERELRYCYERNHRHDPEDKTDLIKIFSFNGRVAKSIYGDSPDIPIKYQDQVSHLSKNS